jgi:hypothetical protein
MVGSKLLGNMQGFSGLGTAGFKPGSGSIKGDGIGNET